MKSNHENPEYSLVLAPEAQSDIDDILQYTIAEWGQNQAEKYKVVLGKGFSSLKYNPGLGHARPDIPAEYRAYQAGQHILIFRVADTTIYVVRVLHGSMDFTDKFSSH